MHEVIGLIEIEDGDFSCVGDATHDESTLDGLFAQLVCRQSVDSDPQSRGNRERSLVMTANLDALADDLAAATREVLTEIFRSQGRRAPR